MLNTDMALVVMGHLKRGKWESVLGSKESVITLFILNSQSSLSLL